MALVEIDNEFEHYLKDSKGRIHGEYKSWHDNGQLATRAFYKHGILHGEYQSWDDDGELASRAYYKEGKPYTYKPFDYN